MIFFQSNIIYVVIGKWFFFKNTGIQHQVMLEALSVNKILSRNPFGMMHVCSYTSKQIVHE